MDAKRFVDSLFTGYEETPALIDFKEELLGNLNAKIENFMKKGMDAQTAFTRASAELGDVSALADELSLKKRKEVFEEVYMDIRTYMKPQRVVAYSLFCATALFGIFVAIMAYFSIEGGSLELKMCSMFGVLLPFLTTAIAGFVFLGVTQETAALYPVSRKRAAWYTGAVAFILFGLFTMPLAYYGVKMGIETAETIAGTHVTPPITNLGPVLNFSHTMPIVAFLGPLIPFVLPGISVLVFMILTEKDRLKPWAKDFRGQEQAANMAMFQNPAAQARFGLYSGAIWMFAIGLFLLLGFTVSFGISWLSFIFAIALQLFTQGMMSKKSAQ